MNQIFLQIWLALKKWPATQLKKWPHDFYTNLIRTVASLIGFLLCLNIIVQWNTIPERKDFVSIRKLAGGYGGRDSVSLVLTSDYYNFGERRADGNQSGTHITVPVTSQSRSIFDYSTWRYKANKDSLEKIIRQFANDDFVPDSLVALYQIESRQDLGRFPWLKFYKPKNLVSSASRAERKDTARYNQILYNLALPYTHRDSNNSLILRTNLLLGLGKTTDFKISANENEYHAGIGANTMARAKNPAWRYFALEDISQTYYTLNFDRTAYERIKRLEIDFSGATRFYDIDPAPDHKTMSSIVYEDPEKLDRIKWRGLTLYCQFLETANLQSVRSFLLTAIFSILFSLFWRYLYKTMGIFWIHYKEKEKGKDIKKRNITVSITTSAIFLLLAFIFYEFYFSIPIGGFSLVSLLSAILAHRAWKRQDEARGKKLLRRANLWLSCTFIISILSIPIAYVIQSLANLL